MSPTCDQVSKKPTSLAHCWKSTGIAVGVLKRIRPRRERSKTGRLRVEKGQEERPSRPLVHNWQDLSTQPAPITAYAEREL